MSDSQLQRGCWNQTEYVQSVIAAKRYASTKLEARRLGADQGELRVLCDEMLKGIGRWLRAAGYDVAIVDDGAHDDDLLARARAEHRLLLTCDRNVAARAGAGTEIAVLGSERLDEAARKLRTRLGIDWLHAPFTRCLIDNARLVPANEEDIAGLPVTARDGAGPIRCCPACGRIYWPGSHVRPMHARLTRWQSSRTVRRP